MQWLLPMTGRREKIQDVFKSVIVGADFSAYSHVVVRQGRLLAEAFNTKMVLVHVIEDLSFVKGRNYDDVIAQFGEIFKKRLIQSYHVTRHERVELSVRFGDAAPQLISECEGRPSPLLVVGHVGHGGLDLLLGSTSEKLALTSPFPVWIHRGEQVKFPEQILIPHDLTSSSDAAVHWGLFFSRGHPENTRILHVHKPATPLSDYETWKSPEAGPRERHLLDVKRLRSRFMKFGFEEVEGDPGTVIRHASPRFDLVAMTPHTKFHLLPALGSVTARIVRRCQRPVLIAPVGGQRKGGSAKLPHSPS